MPVYGIDPKELRAAARLFATGGNGPIYYGLGVTEHSQGTAAVIAIANPAMVVQGSCNIGPFPHELPATAISPAMRCATRSRRPGTSSSTRSRVCATCSMRRSMALSWAFTCRARTSYNPIRTPPTPWRRFRRWNVSSCTISSPTRPRAMPMSSCNEKAPEVTPVMLVVEAVE